MFQFVWWWLRDRVGITNLFRIFQFSRTTRVATSTWTRLTRMPRTARTTTPILLRSTRTTGRWSSCAVRSTTMTRTMLRRRFPSRRSATFLWSSKREPRPARPRTLRWGLILFWDYAKTEILFFFFFWGYEGSQTGSVHHEQEAWRSDAGLVQQSGTGRRFVAVNAVSLVWILDNLKFAISEHRYLAGRKKNKHTFAICTSITQQYRAKHFVMFRKTASVDAASCRVRRRNQSDYLIYIFVAATSSAKGKRVLLSIIS